MISSSFCRWGERTATGTPEAQALPKLLAPRELRVHESISPPLIDPPARGTPGFDDRVPRVASPTIEQSTKPPPRDRAATRDALHRPPLTACSPPGRSGRGTALPHPHSPQFSIAVGTRREEHSLLSTDVPLPGLLVAREECPLVLDRRAKQLRIAGGEARVQPPVVVASAFLPRRVHDAARARQAPRLGSR